MSAYTPTAFKPMRSLVAAAGIVLSPSPPPSDAEDGELFTGTIIIDDAPMEADTSNLDGDHFQPPGMFSTSMMPTIVQTDGKLHVELVRKDGTREEAGKGEDKETELMLPGHVLLETITPQDLTVEGEEGDQTLADDQDFMEGIHFADDNMVKGSRRYFEPEPEDADEEATFLSTADSRRVCQNCKRPGHLQAKCPHVVCTTCGAMDKHERRDCPLSKVCYGCGQRGHHKSECPDPVSRNKRWTGCERCGSREHTDKNCPSLWRVYTFRSNTGRREMQERREKAEGWEREAIGCDERDDWCYNCAGRGHLGDDCRQRRGSLVRLTAPSAFSREISSRGPFTYPNHMKPGNLPAKPTHTSFNDNDPRNVPYTSAYDSFGGSDAGRRGRDKQKDRMRAREKAPEEDADDWFAGDRRPQGRQPANRTPQNDSRASRQANSGRRPWDSELRGREWDRDRDERSRHQPPPLPLSRNPRGDLRHRSRSPPRGGTSHQGRSQDSYVPSSAPPRADYRRSGAHMDDRRDGGAMDSPSVRDIRGAERGSSKASGSKTLVSRALSGLGGLSSTPSQGKSSRGPHAGPSLLNRLSSPDNPAASSGSRNGRRGRGKGEGEDQRDWENEWRRKGGGGGNVASWGDEMDKETRGVRIMGQGRREDRGEVKGDARSDAPKRDDRRGGQGSGQRYYGGYS